MSENPSFLNRETSEFAIDPEFSETRLVPVLENIVDLIKEYKTLSFFEPSRSEKMALEIIDILHGDKETKGALLWLLSTTIEEPLLIQRFKRACLSLDQNPSVLYNNLLRTEESLRVHLEELQKFVNEKKDREERANRLLDGEKL